MEQAYHVLAPFYDQLMDADYQQWSAYLETFLRVMEVEPASILELGCGTGNLTEHLLQWGGEVTAVDRSAAMIEQAEKKLAAFGKKLQLIHADMRELPKLGRMYDAAVCACDGFNYLLYPEDFAAALAGAAAQVRPGGVLLFDLNSAFKLQELYGNETYAAVFPEFSYIWNNSWDSVYERCTMVLTFFIRSSEGLYVRQQERHLQQLWLPQTVEQLLQATGWNLTSFTAFPSWNDPDEDTERWQFAARRQ